MEDSKGQLFKRAVGIYWRAIFLVAWPIVCAPLLAAGYDEDEVLKFTPEMRCAYVVLVMAGYWATATLHHAVIAFIPVVTWPLLGITSTGKVTLEYFKEPVMWFLAAVMIAIAIELCGLHRRLAFALVLCLGCTHRKNPYPSRTTICYYLAIAYSSTIGGIGTLVGTATNTVMRRIFKGMLPDAPQIITFHKWFFVMGPMALLCTIWVWFLLNVQYLGLWRNRGMDAKVQEVAAGDSEAKKRTADAMKGAVKEKLTALGPFKYSEIMVTLLCVILIALWLSLRPDFVKGWGQLSSDWNIAPATPAIFVCILLFVFPATCACVYCLSDDPEKRPQQEGDGLLTWNATKAFPWDLVLLMGGGFAVGRGTIDSGLAAQIGQSMDFLKDVNPILIMLAVSIVALTLTQIFTNPATVFILMPAVPYVAQGASVNPAYIMIGATVCCSLAFLLPVSALSNAYAVAYVHIRTKDMLRTGPGILLSTFVICMIVYISLGNVVFFSSFPPTYDAEWGDAINDTYKP